MYSRRDILVYVSAPIRAPTPEAELANCLEAAKAANLLVEAGFAVVCPHAAYPLVHEVGGRHAPWLESDCAVVRACDVVYVVGAHVSGGMQLELDTAAACGIPVVDSFNQLCKMAEAATECPYGEVP